MFSALSKKRSLWTSWIRIADQALRFLNLDAFWNVKTAESGNVPLDQKYLGMLNFNELKALVF